MRFISEVKRFSLATIIVSAIMGVLFLLFPDACITYMSLFVGAALIVVGAIQIVSYCVSRSSRFSLMLGVIVLIVGIIVCARYRHIISLIVALCGIFVLASGIVDLFAGIKTAFISRIAGIATVVLSIVSIVFGIIAITKSAQLTNGIVQFIGVMLILYSVLDIFAYFEVKRIVSDIRQRTNNDIVSDAVIIEQVDEE